MSDLKKEEFFDRYCEHAKLSNWDGKSCWQNPDYTKKFPQYKDRVCRCAQAYTHYLSLVHYYNYGYVSLPIKIDELL